MDGHKILLMAAFISLMQGLSEDKQFVSESLVSRLQDDDPTVVSCVLKLGQVCLLQYLNKNNNLSGYFVLKHGQKFMDLR